MKLFGVEPPSWRDLGATSKGANKWPIHVKPVTIIDLKKVDELPTASTASKEFFRKAAPWLTDITRYEQVPNEPIKTARFLTKDLERMVEFGKIKIATCKNGSSLDGFPVPEETKQRRRPIFAPSANDYLGRDTLQPLRYKTREEVRQAAIAGTSSREAYHFDFSAFYDAFKLSDDIQHKFMFQGIDGKTYVLCRLAMGQRQACEVAQSVTWLLVDFVKGATVSTTTMIDNVRFVGEQDEVRAAVRQFLQRCKKINVTLNEVDWTTFDPDTDDITQFQENKCTFLGEYFDYQKGTVQVGDKTINKLKFSWQNRQHWTVSRFAAHFGLLFYASNTLHLPLAIWFEALKAYRKISSKVTTGELSWSSRLPTISTTALKELHQWTMKAIENAPHKIAIQAAAPLTHVITTDASATGWGAICVDLNTGGVLVADGRWDAQVKNSVDAEPEGVYRALCCFVPPSAQWNILLRTDHSPIVATSAKRYSAGWAANMLFKRLRAFHSHITFEHVPGVENQADGPSRGRSLGQQEREVALRDALDRADEREEVYKCTLENQVPHLPHTRPFFMV